VLVPAATLLLFGVAGTASTYAQATGQQKTEQRKNFGETGGSVKEGKTLWLTNFTNEQGETYAISTIDLDPKALKAVCGNESATDKDIVGIFNAAGKPVIVFKHGVIALKEKSYENLVDFIVSPEEIKSAKLLEYPGKDGYGILEINGQKKLVIYYERGDSKFIRLYDPKKDPA